MFQINVITRDFFTCDSMTSLAQSMQAISYLEFMADYSAYLTRKSEEPSQSSLDNKINEDVEKLLTHPSMNPFKNCSCQNQKSQALRIKYFQNMEKCIHDITKSRV